MATELQLPILPLRDYQKSVWNYMLQDKSGLRAVTVWPRRNGKDLVAINILAAKALQRKGDYAYIGPFATQARGIIWEGNAGTGKRFIDYIPREVITRRLDQSMKLWLSNGSTIQLYGSDNPDALVGRNFVGLVFTEFSLHKDAVWGYLRPMLAENGGWALFNGTPRGLNHFYQMAQLAERHKDWFYELLTCLDTGFPTQEQIEEERLAGMSESLIQQEFYCSWTASSEETLIPLDFVNICMNTTLVPDDYSHAPLVLGVDPAFAAKGDRAVIIARQGRKVWQPEVYQGMDPMALASRVAHNIKTRHPRYVYVDAGRGEAVWSRLYQMGYRHLVIPVDFGGKTYDPLYHRKKDEMWGRMKDHICHPTLPLELPNDPDLARDLSAPTFIIDERGRLVIETKKQLKSRGFSSTDLGDALALTYAEDLSHEEQSQVTSEMKQLGITEEMARRLLMTEADGTQEYNPLDYLGEVMTI